MKNLLFVSFRACFKLWAFAWGLSSFKGLGVLKGEMGSAERECKLPSYFVFLDAVQIRSPP